MKNFLCIDCGLTTVKVVIFNSYGQKLFAIKDKTPLEGYFIDTTKLWLTLKQLIKKATDTNINIDAVNVSGHGNGLYFMRNGSLSEYAYSSMFNENQCLLEKICDIEVRDKIFNITLQSVWAGQPLQILRYIKETDITTYNSIDKIFFCKDFIKYKLTNMIATDYTDASAGGLIDMARGNYSEELFDILSINDSLYHMPTLKNCYDMIGETTKIIENETGIKKGTPVYNGLFDVNSCMIGSGVIDKEKYSIISGTWGINSIVTDTSVQNKNITQCCNFYDKNNFVCIESAPTSSVNLEWLLKNIFPNISFAQADEICQNTSTDLIYLPYIYKTMKKPNLSASFLNLNASHTYKDMIRAVFEGVALGHKIQLNTLKGDNRITKAVLTGGAANSEIWCQIFADCLDIQIETTKEKETGALGCTVCCSIAFGIYDDLKTATQKMVRMDKTYSPNENNNRYEEKYSIVKSMYDGGNNGF